MYVEQRALRKLLLRLHAAAHGPRKFTARAACRLGRIHRQARTGAAARPRRRFRLVRRVQCTAAVGRNGKPGRKFYRLSRGCRNPAGRLRRSAGAAVARIAWPGPGRQERGERLVRVSPTGAPATPGRGASWPDSRESRELDEFARLECATECAAAVEEVKSRKRIKARRKFV